MPKASPIQTSFDAGELSPLVQGRVDVEKYKKGLAIGVNYIPTLQGPLVRRPGTKFITGVKDPSKPPTLIPFQFSATQSYMLEVGDQYVRFFAREGEILTSSTVFNVAGTYGIGLSSPFLAFTGVRPSPAAGVVETITSSSVVAANQILELVSPYTYLEAAQLKYAQAGDVLYLAHPNHPLRKLQRFGNEAWDLKTVYFQDGPYLANNTYKTFFDSARVGLVPQGAGPGTIIVDAYPFFRIVAAANDGTGRIRLTASSVSHGFLTGDKVFVTGVPGTVEANNGSSSIQGSYWVIDMSTVAQPNQMDLVNSAFVNTMTGSSGFVKPALFQMLAAPNTWADVNPDGLGGRVVAFNNAGVRYWATIVRVLNAGSCLAIVASGNQMPGTSVISAWQMGTYSQGNGFPSCVTFHQDRLALGGAASFPQRLDASMNADYEHFAGSGSSLQVADNNALSFNLLSGESNPLRWIKSSAQGLLAGSGSTEWQVSPNNQLAALTPTNVNAQATSFFGSANVDAVQAGNATLYIQSAYRKVRELNYFFQVGTFRSTDLTELSEHITSPQVTKLVVQKEPYPLVWGLRSDGWLLSMSYNRDDTTIKAGWTRHYLGGQSDSGGTPPVVQSIGVITASSATFDQLWMVTKRLINGTSVVGVETMVPPYNDSMPQEDGFCLDYGATFDNPKMITAITNNGPCIVTAAGHNISNGSSVILTDIIGLNLKTTDINLNTSIANLVNEKTFVVASATVNTFYLTGFDGAVINASSYSSYVSGGRARSLVSHISGLTWLKNETVGIVADGGIHPDALIDSSGVLALQYPSAKVQIGYRYNSDGSTLRSEAGAAAGSSIGMTRRLTRAAFLLHACGDFSFGPSFTNLLPCEFPRADEQQADIAPPLFSGITRDGVEDIYDFDDGLSFRQSSGLPGMVQSITVMMEEVDV